MVKRRKIAGRGVRKNPDFERRRRRRRIADAVIPALVGLGIGVALGVLLVGSRQRDEEARSPAAIERARAVAREIAAAAAPPAPAHVSPPVAEVGEEITPLPNVIHANGGQRSNGRRTNSSASNFSGTVLHVVDGDTIDVSGAPARVRLLGIDAPELGTAPGAKSKQILARLAEGRRVRCSITAYDVYGRAVARCLLSDGRDLSRLMVDRGAAAVDVR